MNQTLPAHWYTSREIFELERQEIFAKSWYYVGATHQLQNPGDFITARVANRVPVIVTRNHANELRAFVNVCKHRGSQAVLCESGNRKSIQCHYHAWTWNLDGQLIAAPVATNCPDFKKQDYPLDELKLETFGPFVFVNLDSKALSMSEQMPGLPEAIAETRIDLGSLWHHQQLRYEINANWKLTIENYLECYHCPVAHPQLVKIVRMDDYKVYPYGPYTVQRCTLKGEGEEDKLLKGAGTSLWPSFTINIYPGIVNVSSTIYEPISPNKTLAIYDVYFPEGVAEHDKKSVVDFLDQVQKEDTVLCEAMQRGLESGYHQKGYLVLEKENGIQHFQKMVYEALAGRADEGLLS